MVGYAGRGMWRCRCDCGQERVVKRSGLTMGKSKSCGCYARDRLTALRREETANAKSRVSVGQRFGMLTVIEHEYPAQFVICHCDCGREARPGISNLLLGKTRSCGCGRYTHRKSATEEHRIWLQMRYRCRASTSPDFARYGAKGVRVCDRWDSFEAFLEDMGPRPSRDHTLDRIDPAGNYEPTNCRWATRIQQQTNRRYNHRLEHEGLNLTISDWSRRTGLSESTILNRLNRGWPVWKTLDTPPKNGNGRTSNANQFIPRGRRSYAA